VKFWKKERSKNQPLGRDYWRLWIAHSTSNLGDGVSSVAYPWLASAVTRSPLLIATVAVVSRLPWLVFTLPAGVITERFDRKKIIVAMDVSRGILALAVAIAVMSQSSSLPSLDDVATNTAAQTHGSFMLYWLLPHSFLDAPKCYEITQPKLFCLRL